MQTKLLQNQQLCQITFLPIQNKQLQLSKSYVDKILYSITEYLEFTYCSIDVEIQISEELLYQNIEELCRNSCQEQIYTVLTKFYKKYLSNEISQINSSDTEFKLTLINIFWQNLKKKMSHLSNLLHFFEVTYLRYTKIKTFETLILTLLLPILEEHTFLLESIRTQCIDQITMSRNQIPIDLIQLQGVLQLLIEVNLYKKIFHKQFLQTSEEFYNQESDSQIKSNINNLPNILLFVEKRLEEEQKLGTELLEDSTIRELMRIIEQKLIVENLQILLGLGFNSLAQQADFENLQRLYQFVERVNKLDFLKKTWNFYIKEVGGEIINLEENQILPKLLDLKVRMIKIIENSFKNSKAFQTSMDYAFEYIMNLKTNTMAQITSSAIDSKLKQEIKLNSDEQSIENDLMIYLDFFKYLTAKDIFEAFYTKRLIKRLLFGLSKQETLEHFVLDKLRQQCGQGYTKKAEDIFQDLEISKSFQLDFHTYINQQQQQLPKLDFYVNIIQSSAWPLSVNNITQQFSPFKEWIIAFENFYSTKQPGKNLTWQIEASTCEIYGYFSEKYTFEVGVLQALLLNLFNSKQEYSYKELSELLKIEKEDLDKTLISLFKMKDSQKLLLKSGDSNNIEDGKFSLNISYSSKSKKVKVSTIQKKESKQEIAETTQKVLQERQYVIDACIVKILKDKKTISHNLLIEEVFIELKLPLQATEIKKRIESLINRDYLSRDPENKMQYNYIA